jgi:hypothetical protein
MSPLELLLLLANVVIAGVLMLSLRGVHKRLVDAERRREMLDRRVRALEAALARVPAEPAAPTPAMADVFSRVTDGATSEPPHRAAPDSGRDRQETAGLTPPEATGLPPVLQLTHPEDTPTEGVRPPPLPRRRHLAAVDWEEFMGARLFAWLGGLALFLGVAYFVKYSFDRDWIPPSMRVVIGLVTGLGLVGGGLRLGQRAYAITSQTLCATGVVVLYAALFAGNALYHLRWLPQWLAFGAMAGVTAGAFLLAVRLPARVIAVLGLLGGFLTPLLLPTPNDQPGALFSYIALLDIGLLAVALRHRWHFLALLGALGTCMIELAWAGRFFAPDRLTPALVIFALFNGLFVAALALARRRDQADDWIAAAPCLVALVTLGFPGWLLADSSFGGNAPGRVFAFVLVGNLALLALARWRERFSVAHPAGGIIAFGYVAFWQARYASPDRLGWALGLITVFAILHVAFPLILWRARQGAPIRAMARMSRFFPALAAAMATLLPFLLLSQLVAQLRLAEPSPVFAVALGMVALQWVLSARLGLQTLPTAGAASVALLQHVWLAAGLGNAARPALAILWAILFLTGFTLFPTVARGLRGSWVWAATVLASITQFHVVYRIVERWWPDALNGLVPLAFVIPPALLLAWEERRSPLEPRGRLEMRAWLGGAILFFITIALPIQFDRQWLTMGLALEGVALLALFRCVPHPGLPWVGVALLALVFVRLIANPNVLVIRGALPLLNWWLYTYGLAAVCCFAGSYLLRSGDRKWADAQVFLTTLGVILLFALLNLEIADFFTQPGEYVRLVFSGNFARDMTFTIAWALFALGLVGAGIARRLAGARWSGLGLLAAAVLKLFLYDLARLDQLYRVGALVAVAAVAIAASTLYQRFTAAGRLKRTPARPVEQDRVPGGTP